MRIEEEPSLLKNAEQVKNLDIAAKDRNHLNTESTKQLVKIRFNKEGKKEKSDKARAKKKKVKKN